MILSTRQTRLLKALLQGPASLRDLRYRIGALNVAQVAFQLRHGHGFDIPCERFAVQDRDGQMCRPGRYHLSNRDRLLALSALGEIEAPKSAVTAFEAPENISSPENTCRKGREQDV